MIIWLIIAAICTIIGTIGVSILYKNRNDYIDSKQTIGTLMTIFGYGIGVSLFLCIIVSTAEYNEFIAQYNIVENYIENNINPDKTIIVNINSKLLEYQTKKQIYSVFSIYPDSILNLEYIKVP
jgi:hypothetical protein